MSDIFQIQRYLINLLSACLVLKQLELSALIATPSLRTQLSELPYGYQNTLHFSNYYSFDLYCVLIIIPLLHLRNPIKHIFCVEKIT